MKAIGGYFGLEVSEKKEYYPDAIHLNTGRNALEYIMISKNYKYIHLPLYTCKVLLEPLTRNNISYKYYSVDKNFEPIFDFSSLKNDECFLYTNYFGFKEEYIFSLSKKCKNLIIDNAQAFYCKPIDGVATFYSPRKFFGVPDGAYLYIDTKINTIIAKDNSFERFEHLLKRIDLSSDLGYSDFIKNENTLSNMPILEMSAITQKLLSSINYEKIALKRQRNYRYLERHLKTLNKYDFEYKENHVPMVYPFFSDNLNLRNRLIENKVYTGQYWKEVLELVENDSIEYQFVSNIVYLPIDQRYKEADLSRIIELIENEHNN